MQPRLKTSTRWTALPHDVISQIEALFRENFQKELKGAKIMVEGKIFSQEILLRVGFLEPGRLTQMNFEVSMGYKLTKEDSAISSLSICVDVCGSLMAEHLEDPENAPELPFSWTEIDFEGKKVWIQHSTTNTELEKKASSLLGEEEPTLVQGDEEAEDVGLEADDETGDEDEDDGDSDDDSGSGRTIH